jgi:excinuclease ABC subunit C
MILQEKLHNLPVSPGVYLMKDSLGGILYVGKAKNVKNRVQSYFRTSTNHSPKIQKLVKHLRDFDIILTDTEIEAFLLECKLIKQLKPPYNRQMKNPLSYCYIVIDRVSLNRKMEVSGSRNENDDRIYFGPFTKVKAVEKALIGLKETFQILCSNQAGKGSACLNYSLGKCCGICLGGKALERYHEILDKFIALLDGTDDSLLEEMEMMMEQAAEDFDFETAAELRDKIDAVKFLLYREKVIDFTIENNKILVMEKLDGERIKVLLIQGTEVIYSQKFYMCKMDIEAIQSSIITSFRAGETRQTLSRDEMDAAQIIYRYLNSNKGSYLTILDHWLLPENHRELCLQIEDFINNNFPFKH